MADVRSFDALILAIEEGHDLIEEALVEASHQLPRWERDRVQAILDELSDIQDRLESDPDGVWRDRAEDALRAQLDAFEREHPA
jgi:hypothetical protein